MAVESFVTDAGLRVPAVTTAQMAEVDRVAIEETGPNLYQMMENAGRNLALTVRDSLEGWPRGMVVVLAGTGGNGGGGICAARHLANQGGDVVVIVTDPGRLGPVPAAQLGLYRQTGALVGDLEDLTHLEADLVVDALIGYSLTGETRGAAARLIGWANASAADVVALDVPSGIDATTGQALGPHINANLTMTLALPKTGLDVAAVGELLLADIGIPRETYRRVGVEVPPRLFETGYRVRLVR